MATKYSVITKLMCRDSDIASGISSGPHEVTCEILQETKDPGGGHEFRLISLTRYVCSLLQG